jgi:hypothetical protein
MLQTGNEEILLHLATASIDEVRVGVHREDKEKTAFSARSGLYQFNVMPFGLCNAPATFERLMEFVL